MLHGTGIFAYIYYHKIMVNVGKYSIHEASGYITHRCVHSSMNQMRKSIDFFLYTVNKPDIDPYEGSLNSKQTTCFWFPGRANKTCRDMFLDYFVLVGI